MGSPYVPGIVECISPDLKDDEVVALAAVQKNGMALEYASQDLKNNKEIVLAAWRQNSMVQMLIKDSEMRAFLSAQRR